MGNVIVRTWAVLAVLLLAATGAAAEEKAGAAEKPAAAGLEAAKPGDTLKLAGREVAVKEMAILPLVRNEYAAVFDLDCYGDAERDDLRKQEKLDEVVAKGKGEFEKQALLMHWTHKRIKLFGPPGAKVERAGEILKAVDEGKAFNCGYYARVLRVALGSLGWVARSIGLKGAKSDGNGSEHGIVEVWSNEHRKWIALDPTLDVYFEKGGAPLNAYEIRQEWFYNEGKDLAIVVGPERKRHTRADLPIARGTHAGFGTLSLKPESIGKFLYVAYTPTTKEGRPDYGKMFIVKDALCEGVTYHTRKNPADPAREPYWPVQQAALKLTPADGLKLAVSVDTLTPDFKGYRSRIDAKEWSDGAPPEWTLHAGTNTLEVVAVNKFGLEGAVSKVVLEVK